MKISAALIVKNEERFLDQCLTSLKGKVDEIVVVDTGSTDRTIEIAKSHGVKLGYFEWCDDFAKARNHAVSLCTGDWVLSIDADEKLHSADSLRPTLTAFNTIGIMAGMVLLHNAPDETSTPEEHAQGYKSGNTANIPRLFRRVPEIYYESCIHENFGNALDRMGWVTGATDVTLVHYGAAAEVIKSRNKVERNVNLLRRQVRETPNQVWPYGYLALEMEQHPDLFSMDEMAEVVETGWALVKKKETRDSPKRLAVVRGYLCERKKEWVELLNTALLAEELEGPSSDIDFIAAMAYENMGRESPVLSEQQLNFFLEAEQRLLFATGGGEGRHVDCFIQGSGSYESLTQLGYIYMCLEDRESAIEYFEKALKFKPGFERAVKGLELVATVPEVPNVEVRDTPSQTPEVRP